MIIILLYTRVIGSDLFALLVLSGLRCLDSFALRGNDRRRLFDVCVMHRVVEALDRKERH